MQNISSWINCTGGMGEAGEGLSPSEDGTQINNDVASCIPQDSICRGH